MLNDKTALSPWRLLNEPGVRRISRRDRRADEGRDGTMVKVCTVNVGTLKGRSREVVDMLPRRGVDIFRKQDTGTRGVLCLVQMRTNTNSGTLVQMMA